MDRAEDCFTMRRSVLSGMTQPLTSPPGPASKDLEEVHNISQHTYVYILPFLPLPG